MPAPPSSSETSLSRLSVLDWIGVLVVGGSAAFALVVPVLIAPVFHRLSDSLGATAPSLPGRVLQGWTPALIGMLPLLLLAAALVLPQPLGRRRLLLLLAFVLTVLASATLLIALYGTLFAMAGSAGAP